MKKNLFLFLFAFSSIPTFVNAQAELSHTTTPIDSRLYEAFSGEYLDNLATANPFLLQRWNFYLDNSWYLTDLPAEKSKDSYATIEVDDLNKINIFSIERKYNLQRDWDKQLVFRIKGTNRAIVLLPGKKFNEKLKEHLNRNEH